MENTLVNGNGDSLPDRATINAHLEKLIAGKLSREDVADWASQFIRGDYDDIQIIDWPAWEMLSTLTGVDIKESPTEYLYGEEDFIDWKQSLANTL